MAIAAAAIAITALTFGVVVSYAQPAGRGPGFGGPSPMGRFPMGGFFGPRIAAELNLTDAQKEQAKAIFSDAREQSKPLVEQLRAGHEAVADAVKTGKPDSELERLTGEQGVLTGKVAAVHAKAFAKFWNILTPEQKAKADEIRANFKERMSHWRERWLQNRG